jgi:sulfur-carrier protein
MQIHVKLFARAKDLAGASSCMLDLPLAVTVGVAKATLVERYPQLVKLMPVMLVAVDGSYAHDQTVLTHTCELACFPPVSGG